MSIKVTSFVHSGLGNQLFQLFNLISYSVDNKFKWYIVDSEPVDKNRPFYWNSILKNVKPFLTSETVPSIKYNEPRFSYSKIPEFTDNVIFTGYFQSWKYFEHNKNEIIKLLGFESIKEELASEYNYSNLISMHFRIGDYIHHKGSHPIMDESYYIGALREMINVTGRDDWRVLYFCEDDNIELVRSKIVTIGASFHGITFQKINSKYSDWEQLLIMSLCQHNIVANSTFSWWGSYLNENNNTVYYPDKWFGENFKDSHDVSDLCPDDWHRVACD